jgi:hypothetical protein
MEAAVVTKVLSRRLPGKTEENHENVRRDLNEEPRDHTRTPTEEGWGKVPQSIARL